MDVGFFFCTVKVSMYCVDLSKLFAATLDVPSMKNIFDASCFLCLFYHWKVRSFEHLNHPSKQPFKQLSSKTITSKENNPSGFLERHSFFCSTLLTVEVDGISVMKSYPLLSRSLISLEYIWDTEIDSFCTCFFACKQIQLVITPDTTIYTYTKVEMSRFTDFVYKKILKYNFSLFLFFNNQKIEFVFLNVKPMTTTCILSQQ